MCIARKRMTKVSLTFPGLMMRSRRFAFRERICFRSIFLERGRRHEMAVEPKRFGRKTEREPDELRQMQDWHGEFLRDILFHLALEPVEYGVAQRARRDHGLRAAGFGGSDVLTRKLDSNVFIVCCGMEPTALHAAGIVDGFTTENSGEALQRDIVARVYESVAQRRTSDVAALESGDSHTPQRVGNKLSEPLFADVLVQHPKEMAD